MSLSEMVFLAFLGLVIFGPKKLAHAGQYVGRALTELKKTSVAFQAQLAEEIKTSEGVHGTPPDSYVRNLVRSAPGSEPSARRDMPEVA